MSHRGGVILEDRRVMKGRGGNASAPEEKQLLSSGGAGGSGRDHAPASVRAVMDGACPCDRHRRRGQFGKETRAILDGNVPIEMGGNEGGMARQDKAHGRERVLSVPHCKLSHRSKSRRKVTWAGGDEG